MLKKIILIATAFFLTTTTFCQTPAGWQGDLRYLQNTVHSKYSNLFYNTSASDWDKSVDDLYNNIPNLDKVKIIAEFTKLVALFHIGHTQINLFALSHHQGPALFNRIPLQFYWFSDGLYILRAAKNYEQVVGSKVIKMGHLKTEDALNAIRPLVPFENEEGFRSMSMFFLSIPEFLQAQGITDKSTEVPVTLTKNGKEETVVFTSSPIGGFFSMTGLEAPQGWVSARTMNTIPLWQKEPEAFRYMEYLRSTKTLYVRHSVTLNDGDKTIESFFKNMVEFIDKNDVQKLVLDIRMNGGGNNYLNKPIITSIIASGKINQKGKFFCIIGRRTFSAAQNLVNELEKYTEVIFVGEPTSENVNFYGDTRTETLPNSKLQANLSWLWWQNLDARDKRKATSPTLAAEMSFNDYYANEDPAMKAVFNYENETALIPGLADLLRAGKNKEALKFANDYKENSLHRFTLDRMEAEINTEAYNDMRAPKLDEANALFEINTKLFPESANAYDSYAESFMNMDKNEEAIKYYEMAIAKDKDGITAENSKKMIEKIRNGKHN